MPKTASGSLTTTGATASTGIVNLDPDDSDNMATFQISGTYGTVTFVFEGTVDNTNFFPLPAVAMADSSVATGTLAPTDNTTRAWRVPCAGCSQVRLYISAIASGTVVVYANSQANVGTATISVSTTSATSASTTNITSAASTAFTVGPNGTTNPTFQVDASVSSEATGVKITGAAAASRAKIAVISSGTDEGLSIDAKGAGTIRLGATSTGSVEFSRAAIPTANDGVALGVSGTAWSDIFLASGAVINFNAGNVTMTHGAADITFAGATTFKLGAVTLNVTGTRIVQSYHTNLTSTNAVTVDSSETVKNDILPYSGDALAVIESMDVITYKHDKWLDPGQGTKLGIRAESVKEPLAVDAILHQDGSEYPGVNTYGLATLHTRAIQQLLQEVRELKKKVA